MSFISESDLKFLADQSQSLCVSIYMPTYRAGAETRQNSVRFKDLIRQAEAQLQEQGLSQSETAIWLQPILDLDREEFWQHQNNGLAIFYTEGTLKYFCVPLAFDELVVVGQHFHLKPLMPLLVGDGEFYLLTLSQKNIRFFQGSRYSMEEIEVEGLPKSMDEALQYDETAKEGQFRISTSKGGTNNSFQHAGSFHGQGSPDRDDVKQDILQYFHVVDRALHEFLQDKRSPLVLAGVEYLLPIYREANTYQYLIDEGIPENVKILEADELHAQTWPIVEPYFMEAKESAIERFHEMQVTGKTSTNVEEVVPAACYGRVDQLFVAVGVQQWGNFDPESNHLEIHDDTQPGDEDLLNIAAIQTFLNGGTVYAVEPDKVPESAPLAAVFRY